MRHGVDMTSQQHPLPLAAPCGKAGARHKRVAMAGYLQVRQAAQRPLDRVRERALLAAD